MRSTLKCFLLATTRSFPTERSNRNKWSFEPDFGYWRIRIGKPVDWRTDRTLALGLDLQLPNLWSQRARRRQPENFFLGYRHVVEFAGFVQTRRTPSREKNFIGSSPANRRNFRRVWRSKREFTSTRRGIRRSVSRALFFCIDVLGCEGSMES